MRKVERYLSTSTWRCWRQSRRKTSIPHQLCVVCSETLKFSVGKFSNVEMGNFGLPPKFLVGPSSATGYKDPRLAPKRQG